MIEKLIIENNVIQNKSVRRNRKERLKSAHSSNRDNKNESQKEQNKRHKKSIMKNATSRVMPKVWGNSNEISKSNNRTLGKVKINEMLNQKSNSDYEQKGSTNSKVPFPNKKDQ